MRRTPATLAAALTAAALALSGCGGTAAKTGDRPPASTGSYPVTVGTVTLDKRPTHIVSLSPTATEMLFAIGAGGQVTAVDELSSYPREAPRTNLSGLEPNAEAIAGRNPDLVVISNDMNKIADQLTQLKIPVLLAPAAKTLDDTYNQLAELGRLTGHETEAADVSARTRSDIAKMLKELPPRSKPLTYYWELDPTYYSVTSTTFVGTLLSQVGLDNIADPADASGAAGGYPQLSAESIVKANPDLIFLADATCCQQTLDTVRARAGWAGVAAVENGRVYPIDDDIASRWGPRVVDLLRSVTDAVAKVPA